MSEILKVSDDGRFRVRLVADEDCESPRESDSLSHVVTVPHSHYRNVDKSGGPLGDGWDRIKDQTNAMDLFERWARIFHGAVTLRDTPERGADAIWYLMPDNDASDPAAYLECELRDYRLWAEGDTYGCVIEKTVTYVEVEGDRSLDQWEGVGDDLWGLIGFEYARDTALAAFEAYLKSEENGNLLQP